MTADNTANTNNLPIPPEENSAQSGENGTFGDIDLAPRIRSAPFNLVKSPRDSYTFPIR